MKFNRTLLMLAGTIGVVTGVMGAAPAFVREEYILMGLALLFVILGLVLISLGFSDDDDQIIRKYLSH